MDEKILEKYIYNVNKILDLRYAIPSENEFKKQIALTGITEEELKFVQEQGVYYKSQARTLIVMKRYKAAAAAIEKVLSILPFDAEVYTLAANANYKAYFESKDLTYLQRASEFTQKGFALMPQNYFFPKMEDIIKETQVANTKFKQWDTYRNIAFIVCVISLVNILLFLAMLIVLWWVNTRRKKALSNIEKLREKAEYLDIL